MIKGVLFDMDGVLVDNAAMHAKSFELLYDRYQISERNDVSQFYGCGLREIIGMMIPKEMIDKYGVEKFCLEKEEIYREIYAETIHPINGLRELLEKLKQAGVKCAVGSSGCIENVNFVLEHCDIADYFEGIVCASQVSKCKPDPEIYLTAAAQLKLAPAECMVFEDAPSGIQSAKRAGVDHTVALTTSFSFEEIQKHEPDFIVRDFTEVTDEML